MLMAVRISFLIAGLSGLVLCIMEFSDGSYLKSGVRLLVALGFLFGSLTYYRSKFTNPFAK